MATRSKPTGRAQLNLASEIAWRLYPHTFAHKVTDGKWRAFDYQALIGRLIARAVVKKNGRLLITLPSRHGKSDLCSKWTPTWFLDNLPQERVILTSYGAELAENFGRQVRNEFASNPHLITKLREDSKAAGRWNTPEGGGMLAVGVGGPVLGFGGNLILVDDGHKDWAEAQSPTMRQRVIDWFSSTLYSRLEPGGTMVVLQQRLHEKDLAGFLMSEHGDDWEVIRLPALAVEGDPMGRLPGTALCPQRYDEQALKRIQAGLSAQAWAAMYQQDPEVGAAGRAYHKYDPSRHDDKTLRLRDDLPVQLAWDFNVNPGVHCIVCQYDKREDRFSAVHEIHGPRMKTQGAMEALAAVLKRYQRNGRWPWAEVQIFGDRSGKTETTTTTVTDYRIIEQSLERMGLKFRRRVPAANPPIKTRVEAVNDALSDAFGESHVAVNPLECPRLVEDFKRVKEDDDGLIDKTDDDLTHPSDAFGYLVHYQRPVRGVMRNDPGQAGAVE